MGNKTNVWSNFQKLFSILIQPFMASPPMPHIPELFISTSASRYRWLEVENWACSMQSRDDAAQCFVERVVHCKCEAGKQHEFLRLEISSPTGSPGAVAFVDRRVDVSQGVKQRAAVLSPSPSQTVSNSETILATDVVWFAAKDCDSETSLRNEFGKYLELRTLTFPQHDNRPSAQYLGTLLQTISTHARHYELYAHQCYWFAHTVFESLQTLHPMSSLSNGHDHKKRSQYRGSDFPKADSVDKVCNEFREAWKNFLDRKEEVRKVHIAEQKQVSVGPIVLTRAKRALTAAGEGSGRGPGRGSSRGSGRGSSGTGGIGEDVGNSATGVRS